MPKPLRLAVVVLAGLLAQACGEAPQAALGTLEWDRVDGRAVVSEPIVEVWVHEGERVEAGQPILRLDTRLQDARIARGRAQLLQAEALLADRKRGFREEEVAAARTELEAARSDLATRDAELRRQKSLLAKEVVSKQQLEEFENRVAQSRARVRAAEEELALRTKGFRPAQIEEAAASVEATRAELDYLEQERARYTVRAERAGVLDSLPFKLGDKPPAQAVVSTVLAGDRPWARVYLPEPWLGRVHIGDAVRVEIDGREAPFEGRVRHIESQASFTPYFALAEQDRQRLSYVTEVDLLGDEARTLRVGIPVRVRPPGE